MESLCSCYMCQAERDEIKKVVIEESIFHLKGQMILCPVCGNKRCPHASDHKNPCTHSNEPGQPGSVY